VPQTSAGRNSPDANLRALKDAGIRGRFSYGAPQAHPAVETIDSRRLRAETVGLEELFE